VAGGVIRKRGQRSSLHMLLLLCPFLACDRHCSVGHCCDPAGGMPCAYQWGVHPPRAYTVLLQAVCHAHTKASHPLPPWCGAPRKQMPGVTTRTHTRVSPPPPCIYCAPAGGMPCAYQGVIPSPVVRRASPQTNASSLLGAPGRAPSAYGLPARKLQVRYSLLSETAFCSGKRYCMKEYCLEQYYWRIRAGSVCVGFR